MLAASSFDDIIAITVFSIFVSVSFDQIGAEGESLTVKQMIGMNIFYIVTGMFFGVILGLMMSCFNKAEKRFSENGIKWTKFVLMLVISVLNPIFCNNVGFGESKYIGIITFGFVCFNMWGEKKPDKELATFWKICQPFLFGTIGASVQFANMDGSVVGKALGVILIGLFFRWFATYLAVSIESGKYTTKERGFMAFAWMPKATVQAAIGGVVLDTASSINGLDDETREIYKNYGTIMLTVAVIAIVFTAPLGAILINTLGIKWLTYDGISKTEITRSEDKDIEVVHVI